MKISTTVARTSLVIIDDFYDDPDHIRSLALACNFSQKTGATYPGLETYVDGMDWSEVRNKLRAYIPEDVDGPSPKKPPFLQGQFRIAWGEHEQSRMDKVHVDQQRWSGVVYLTPDEHCREGIIFYKHQPTGTIGWIGEYLEKNFSALLSLDKESLKLELLKILSDPEQFEMIGIIPMRYNRAIVFMAQVLHGTGVAFGNGPENGRLTQHFEFYSTT